MDLTITGVRSRDDVAVVPAAHSGCYWLFAGSARAWSYILGIESVLKQSYGVSITPDALLSQEVRQIGHALLTSDFLWGLEADSIGLQEGQ